MTTNLIATFLAAVAGTLPVTMVPSAAAAAAMGSVVAMDSAVAPVVVAAGAAHRDAAHVVPAAVHVRITARIVVVDTEAVRRAGVSYVVLGGDRVDIGAAAGGRQPGRGVRVGTHGVGAFLDIARENRWVRSESTHQILTLSGSAASVSSGELTLDRHTARSRGPMLMVVPTVRADGFIELQVSAGIDDVVVDRRGYYGVDASPVSVRTTVIAVDREPVILASGMASESTRETGLLRLRQTERERDVLVVVTAEVIR